VAGVQYALPASTNPNLQTPTTAGAPLRPGRSGICMYNETYRNEDYRDSFDLQPPTAKRRTALHQLQVHQITAFCYGKCHHGGKTEGWRAIAPALDFNLPKNVLSKIKNWRLKPSFRGSWVKKKLKFKAPIIYCTLSEIGNCLSEKDWWCVLEDLSSSSRRLKNKEPCPRSRPRSQVLVFVLGLEVQSSAVIPTT